MSDREHNQSASRSSALDGCVASFGGIIIAITWRCGV